MKKTIFIFGLIGTLLTGCLSIKNVEIEEKESVLEKEEPVNLEGEWKVTEYIASHMMRSDFSIEEHFLGRSIVIGPETIVTSLYYWPDEIRYRVDCYRMIELETVSSYDSRFKGKNYITKKWDKVLGEQDLTVLTYSMGELLAYNPYLEHSFLVTQDGQVICQYYSNYYFMERYKEAETDLSIEQLIGNWHVKRLVSYQDGWKGNNSVAGLWEMIGYKKISEEQGANFYPEEFIDNIVKIKASGIELYQENQLVESCVVEDYTSLLVDKHDYQKEKGVHDGLGIANEEIQVFVGEGQIEEGKLLDGEIIVINEDEVIIKLYQGWYLLEKKV